MFNAIVSINRVHSDRHIRFLIKFAAVRSVEHYNSWSSHIYWYSFSIWMDKIECHHKLCSLFKMLKHWILFNVESIIIIYVYILNWSVNLMIDCRHGLVARATLNKRAIKTIEHAITDVSISACITSNLSLTIEIQVHTFEEVIERERMS